MQAVLQELNEDHRAVVVLRHFTECSYRQIGEILQIPEKTVKSRLFSARQQMKDRLQSRGIEF
ncbi:ECF RNA polymerase sigma-E factor [compost metagenome]